MQRRWVQSRGKEGRVGGKEREILVRESKLCETPFLLVFRRPSTDSGDGALVALCSVYLEASESGQLFKIEVPPSKMTGWWLKTKK